jgi:hypothetical protein
VFDHPFDHPDKHPFDHHGNPAPACRMAERWLTYQEAGEVLGMSAEAARQRARRLKWRTQRGNDGKALVLVPEAVAVRPRVRPPVRTAGQTPVQPPVQTDDDKALADAIAAFLEVEARLRADLEALRAHANQADATVARQAVEMVVQAERVGRSEAEAAVARDALARELRRAEQAEAAQKTAELQAGAALASRDAMQAELDAWTAGGPLARMWRAFWHRHKAPPWR